MDNFRHDRPPAISRRAFLLATLLFAGTLAAGGRIAWRRLERRGERRLLGLFPDPATVVPIGAAYLRLHPEEGRRGPLLRALRGDLGWWRAQASGDELRARVAGRIRDDFGHGRMVRVDGWYLSRTEARLSALAALAAGAAEGVASPPAPA